jgi:1-acyl-sn-glycerol-3-phosphate acyltransferase
MKRRQQIIYYNDMANDEFSAAKIVPKRIDGTYVYCHDGIWKGLTHFFWYRIVANPLAFVYLKLKFRHKIINKRVLKASKNEGYFIFGNHTQPIADALIPTKVSNPKDTYVIVNPENVSMPVLGRITPSLGALPLPGDIEAARHFMDAVKRRAAEGRALCVYPEAHIWPYYTGIRPFSDKSFAYPIKLGCPVYCFTNTYQTKGKSRKVRIHTYVDGPFLPDKSLAPDKQKRELRDRVYETMRTRAQNSNVEVIRYVRRETP